MIHIFMIVAFLINFSSCNALQVTLKNQQIVTLTADQIKLLSNYSQTVRDDLHNQSSLINLPAIDRDIFLFLINTILPSLNDPKKAKKLLDNFKKNHSVDDQENLFSLIRFLDIEALEGAAAAQKPMDIEETIFEITWPTDKNLQKIYNSIFDASQTLKNYLADQNIERKAGNKIPTPGLTKSHWDLLVVATKQLKDLTQKPAFNDVERLSSLLSLNELAALSQTADFFEMPILINAISNSIALRLHKKETLKELYKNQNSLKEIIELLTPAMQNTVRNSLLNLIAQQRKISQQVRNVGISQNGKLIAGIAAKKILLWHSDNLEKKEQISIFDEHAFTIGVSPDGSLIAAYMPSSGEIFVYNVKRKQSIDAIKVDFIISQIEFSDGNKHVIATGPKAPIIFAQLTDGLPQVKQLTPWGDSYFYRDLENIYFAQLSFIQNTSSFSALYLQRLTETSHFVLTSYVTGNSQKKQLSTHNFIEKFTLSLGNPSTAFSQAQQMLAFISNDELILYSIATEKIDPLLLSRKKLNLISSLALNQEASLLAIGYSNGQLELYSTQAKKLIMTFELLPEKINFLQFAADNTLLASSTKNIYLYDTAFENYFLQESSLSLAEIVVMTLYKLITAEKKEPEFLKDSYLWSVFSALPDDVVIALHSWAEKK
jgi:WD40 repeat protein